MRTLLFLLLAATASAQPWLTQKLLVVPGKSIGLIRLGKPVPRAAYQQLGKPSSASDVSKNTSTDGAAIEWLGSKGPYIRVKCHDGNRPENVFQVFWTAPGPRTAEGIGIGSTAAQVRAKYPKGKSGEPYLDADETWSIPGLTMVLDGKNGKVVEMNLHNP
ncbi:MAG: hypothetical protein J0I12_16140 [Candidatus Eremiobacteraeota bacterium]|nr:hypothetical protein [Candidatus Eremiobacteraeota bacterium]